MVGQLRPSAVPPFGSEGRTPTCQSWTAADVADPGGDGARVTPGKTTRLAHTPGDGAIDTALENSPPFPIPPPRMKTKSNRTSSWAVISDAVSIATFSVPEILTESTPNSLGAFSSSTHSPASPEERKFAVGELLTVTDEVVRVLQPPLTATSMATAVKRARLMNTNKTKGMGGVSVEAADWAGRQPHGVD